MFSRKFYFVLLLSLVGLTGTLVGCDCDEPRDLGSTRELEASPKSVTFDSSADNPISLESPPPPVVVEIP